MSRVFICTDPHLGHEKLCIGLRNMTAEESDELIIRNWNSVVGKRDTVFVLGDFVFEKPKLIEKYVKQLNGTIIICGGNHDTVKCCKEFQRLGITVVGNIQYKGYILSHIPIHPTQLENTRGNIHGHIHNSGIIDGEEYMPETDLGPFYFNANLELNNYTPILFEDLVEKFTEQINSRPGECQMSRMICPLCAYACPYRDPRISLKTISQYK